jgi:hypothetical protein
MSGSDPEKNMLRRRSRQLRRIIRLIADLCNADTAAGALISGPAGSLIPLPVSLAGTGG